MDINTYYGCHCPNHNRKCLNIPDGIQTAGRNESLQSLIFVLIQLHFCQQSGLSFCLPSLIVQQAARIFSLLAIAHDCETGLNHKIPLKVPGDYLLLMAFKGDYTPLGGGGGGDYTLKMKDRQRHSDIVAVKISITETDTKQNKYTVISKHNDKFQECFELQVQITG